MNHYTLFVTLKCLQIWMTMILGLILLFAHFTEILWQNHKCSAIIYQQANVSGDNLNDNDLLISKSFFLSLQALISFLKSSAYNCSKWHWFKHYQLKGRCQKHVKTGPPCSPTSFHIGVYSLVSFKMFKTPFLGDHWASLISLQQLSFLHAVILSGKALPWQIHLNELIQQKLINILGEEWFNLMEKSGRLILQLESQCCPCQGSSEKFEISLSSTSNIEPLQCIGSILKYIWH